MTDSSGAVIPNVQVIINDVETGVARTVSANALLHSPNLQPGPNEVKVAAPGFRTRLEKGITLRWEPPPSRALSKYDRSSDFEDGSPAVAAEREPLLALKWPKKPVWFNPQ